LYQRFFVSSSLLCCGSLSSASRSRHDLDTRIATLEHQLPERVRRRAGRPPTSGPRRRPTNNPKRARVHRAPTVSLATIQHRRLSSRGSGSDAWVATQRSSSIRARTSIARLPETVQSRSGHVSGGTFFVTVAGGDAYSNRTRRARDTRRRCDDAYASEAVFKIAPSGTTPRVT
jgi:hypothetical protein